MTSTPTRGTQEKLDSCPKDRARFALEFVVRLLDESGGDSPSLPNLLSELAGAFEASGAGIVSCVDGKPLVVERWQSKDQPSDFSNGPWEGRPELRSQVREALQAVEEHGP